VALVQNLPNDANEIGNNMQEIARRRYTWDQIGEAYFALLEDRQQK
jgi:glycosyltransferase involved in cell wall biosynthesis